MSPLFLTPGVLLEPLRTCVRLRTHGTDVMVVVPGEIRVRTVLNQAPIREINNKSKKKNLIKIPFLFLYIYIYIYIYIYACLYTYTLIVD